MSYKACLFDLDGVLVDTAIYHFQAWKKLGENFNYQLTEEQNEQLKGISRVESLNRILAWANFSATAEQKETLNLDDKAKKFLGWAAKIDIIKYINKKYSLKNE